MKQHDVIILFGGSSDERRVSVASGQNIARVLEQSSLWFQSPDGRIYECSRAELLLHERPFELDFKPASPPVYENLSAALRDEANRRRIFFLGLHGGEGENGTLQQLFEDRGVAFTGSGSIASAKAFDKTRAKAIVKDHGLRIADSQEIDGGSPAEAREKVQAMFSKYGDIILKPIAGGSSIGLYHVKDAKQIEPALKEISLKGNIPYLIENFITGKEITIGVLDTLKGPRALPPSEVRTAPDVNFDYEGKYLGRGSQEITPAEISPEETEACQKYAIIAHRALGCEGYTRTDVVLAHDGPWYLETNTLPGVTQASFIPQQLAAAKIPFADFAGDQIRIAIARRDRR